MTEYNIEQLVGEIDFDKNRLHQTNKNLFLTNYEIAVLKKYHINYDQCKTAKEVLQKIETIISDLEDFEQDELDQVGMSIAERDYYQNTNK